MSLDRHSPFALVAGGLKVRLVVRPGAANERIGPISTEAAGGTALGVAVTAPASGGAANRALIKLLAKAWRLPRTSLIIAAGSGSRRKILLIEGDADGLNRRLNEWMRRAHD